MADVVGRLRVLLEADASEFDKAIKEASTDIKDLAGRMRKDLEPSARAVNSAVRDFLGGPEIKRAQTYAAAITKIGDVSKLTAKDQQRVNAAITEAINHYKVLGIQAPKNLLEIQKATANAAKATQSASSSMAGIGTTLKSVAGAIGVTFSAGALIGFTKSVFDTASSIDDMSKRLNVSAEFAQKFKFALEQTGSSLEAGQKAIATMNNALAEGNKSTVAALERLGIKLEDIRRKKPEEAFLEIANAARQIPDPMERAAVMQDLFGRGAVELMPLVVEGYDKVTQGVITMSNETVTRLADAQDQWDKFFTFLTIHSGEAIGSIMRDLEGLKFIPDFLADLADTGGNLAMLPAVMQRNRANRLARGPRSSTAGQDRHLGREIEAVTQATQELTEAQKKAKAEAEAYAKRIKAIADQLTGKKLAQEIRELADAVKLAGGESGITAQELADLADKLDKIQQRGGQLTPELEAIRNKFAFFRDMVKATRQELELLSDTPAFRQVMQGGDRSSRSGAFQNMPLIPGASPLSPATMQGPPLNDWREGIGDLIDGFEDLATIAGDTFSGITRGIGSALSASDLFSRGWEQIGSAKTFSGILSGLGSVAGAIGQGIQLAIQLGKALHDAFTRSEAEKAAADIRRNFGVDVTEDSAVAKSIERMVKETGIDRNLAIELHLPDIIREGGGVDASNFASFRDRAQELFDDIRLGGETGERALRALDDTIQELGQHVTEQGGVWDRDFVQMLKRAQAEGHNLASVMELVTGQLNIAGSGVNTAIGGFVAGLPADLAGVTGKEADTKRKAVVADQQDDFDRLSRIALATFNAYIQNGHSAAEAIAAVGPSIDQLKQATTDFGFAGNEAFNQLSRWRDLVTQNQPILDQVSGLNEAMTALANVGALTQDTFTDMQVQLSENFAALQEGGMTQQEALAQMVPTLETLRELHNERGLAISDETAALIEQAEQQGLLAEEQMSTNDVLMEGLGAVIEALGGTIPEKWREMAETAKEATTDIADTTTEAADTITDDLGDAIADDAPWRDLERQAEETKREMERLAKEMRDGISGELDDLEFTVDVNFDVDDMPRIRTGDLPGFKRGGVVDAGPDGAPILVHGKEAIVPLEGPDAPPWASLIADWNAGPSLPSLSMSGAVAAMDREGGGAGEPFVIHNHIHIEGREAARAIFPYVPEQARRFRSGV